MYKHNKNLVKFSFQAIASLWLSVGLAQEACQHIFVKSSEAVVRSDVDYHAVSIVKELESLSDHFLSQEGYENYESFQGALQNSKNRKLARAAQILNKEKDLNFAIRGSSSNRDSVATYGFLNQHETKTSSGILGPNRRNVVEASYLNLSVNDYRGLRADLKPKYGYLSGPIARKDKVGVTSYGDDIYLFKKESLKDRVTFSVGDSFNRMQVRLGKRVEDGPDAKAETPEKWDQIFHPWSRKDIAVPFIYESLIGKTEIRPIPDRTEVLESQAGYDYVELQFWGTLNLQNVESFAFTQYAPKGKFLKLLLANGIKILKVDPNTGEFTPWTPPK